MPVAAPARVEMLAKIEEGDEDTTLVRPKQYPAFGEALRRAEQRLGVKLIPLSEP